MQALVDSLSKDLSDRYLQYLESFMVDVSSEDTHLEFRTGFTLRRDHVLRTLKLSVPTLLGETDAERDLLVVVIFEQIEELLDKAIAEDKVRAN